MRHGRAEHEGAERALGRVVVGEPAGAGDQRLVLLAADGGAHAELDRGDIVHDDPAGTATLFSSAGDKISAGLGAAGRMHGNRSQGGRQQPG